jgi:uncharacterized protein with HEPN domain
VGEMAPGQFASSLLHQDAAVHALQIIGEAARRVSEETKRELPQIDWIGIIGMRHRLVHDYRQVRIDIVWHILRQEVPQLIQQLEQIVPPDEPAS